MKREGSHRHGKLGNNPVFKVLRFEVSGTDCASCSRKIERRLSSMNGVERVSVSPITGKAVVGYDSSKTSLLDIEEAIRGLGYGVKCEKAVFQLGKTNCPECIVRVEEFLSGLDGVCSASSNPVTGKLLISFNRDLTSSGKIRRALEGVGYETIDERSVEAGNELRRRLVGAARLFLVGAAAVADWLDLLPVDVALPVVAICAFPIFREAYFSLKAGSITVPVFMSIGILASLLIGEHEAALLITFFMLIAGFLDEFTTEQAKKAIGELVKAAPTTARVKRGGKEFEVDVGHVKKGDIVIVRAGEKIPVDGVVVEGGASVNQASITGESLPLEKTVGDKVFAGTLSEGGVLQVRATELYSESTFARIISLVEEAESSKAPAQKIADRFTQYFAPLVLVVAALTLFFTQNPLYAIAVVVVACPCAVALATPLAVVASTGKAAKHGIIIKGGVYLETLSKVDVVVMDKTGTLTFGKPRVVETRAFAKCGEREIIRLAAVAEKFSEHLLAKSVLAKAAEYDVIVGEPEKFEVVKGKGVVAYYEKKRLVLGNRELLKDHGIPVSGGVEDFAASQEEKGRTVLLLAHGNAVCGAICVADTIRDNAAQAIRDLKAAGIGKVIMLTGDNPRVAQAVAAQTGVDEVVAEMLPEEKVERVRRIMREGGKVAMVGDGVNDAPALAAADVGIAMGAAGSDVAIETADVALMKDDLSAIVDAVKIGRHTFSTIKQNIAFAMVFNVVGVGLAAAGFLTPVLAAIAHALPDLLVSLNSSKLFK